MSEHIALQEREKTDYSVNLEKIGRNALFLVDHKYGRGTLFTERREGELPFHNGEHSRMVGRMAAKMCATLELPSLHQELGRTVGYSHDLVQLKGAGTNETESASWLENSMNDFPRILKAMAGKAIIGTTPVLKNDVLTGQYATELDYSSLLEEQFVKSVACADLSELYSPIGPYMAHQLHREFNINATEEELFQRVLDFQRRQCEILEGYRYPLSEGEELFGARRSEIIAYTEATLTALESGDIGSWNELLERDKELYRTLVA